MEQYLFVGIPVSQVLRLCLLFDFSGQTVDSGIDKDWGGTPLFYKLNLCSKSRSLTL